MGPEKHAIEKLIKWYRAECDLQRMKKAIPGPDRITALADLEEAKKAAMIKLVGSAKRLCDAIEERKKGG